MKWWAKENDNSCFNSIQLSFNFGAFSLSNKHDLMKISITSFIKNKTIYRLFALSLKNTLHIPCSCFTEHTKYTLLMLHLQAVTIEFVRAHSKSSDTMLKVIVSYARQFCGLSCLQEGEKIKNLLWCGRPSKLRVCLVVHNIPSVADKMVFLQAS